MPYICSVQVPLTAKSVAIIGQPMRSRFATNGSKVTGSMPAITGSTKYGPKLKHNNNTAQINVAVVSLQHRIMILKHYFLR